MSSSHGTPHQNLDTRQRLICAIGLFALLSGVYLLSYSGVYHSGDEIAYVKTAIDLIRGRLSSASPGELTDIIDVLIFARPGDIGPDGEVAGGAGPFTLLLAVVLLLTRDFSAVGSLQILFLINIVTTALTAVFLFLVAIELRYRLWPAMLLALLYGLATPAWVYSKQLFRDPLAALGLAAMLYFLVRFHLRQSYLSALLALLALAIAVTTRTSTIVVAPFAEVYLAMVVVRHGRNKAGQQRVSWLLAGIVLVIVSAVTVAVVFVVAERYEHFLEGTLNIAGHGQAFASLFLSPGRGILFYAPILLLSMVGMVAFGRRHPWESLVLIGSTACYLVVVGAYPMWWGGWGWGSRYLVPILPFFILPIVALIEPMVTGRSPRWLLIPVGLVILLSLVTQVIGAAVGPNTASFQSFEPSTFSSWQYTPLAQITAANRVPPDLAWLYLDGSSGNAIAAVIASLALVILGALLVWLARTRDRISTVTLIFASAVAVVTLCVPVWLVHHYSSHDARYQSPDGFATAIKLVRSLAQTGDILIYDHPKPADVHRYPSLVSNFCALDCPPTRDVTHEYWASTPIEDKRAWLEHIQSNFSRVWVVSSGDSQMSLESRLRTFLDVSLFHVGCSDISVDVALCQYESLAPSAELAPRHVTSLIPLGRQAFLPSVVSTTSPNPVSQLDGPSKRSIKLNASFGDRIGLYDVRLYWNPPAEEESTNEIVTLSGKPLLVELLWRARAPIDTPYHALLQLFDSAGGLVSQIDRDPVGGVRQTSSWGQGELISDRYAFEIPASLPAGQYQLILSLYDLSTGTRLSTASGDSIKLTDLTVVAQP